ncbi:MAG: hypothetical protein MJ133_08835 [Lachnospiraceae bacterium]|nr:hypothetical protein [Lachnospiraceae bacterium]
MTISRVELQGQTMRTQDFTSIKHNEDAASMVQQSNVSRQRDKAVDNRLHQVNDSEQADNRQKKFDAKDEGSNAYYGDGGKNRASKNKDGRVIVKGKQQGGFDLKI